MNALQNMVGGLESVSMERTGNEIKIVISPAAQEAFLDAIYEEKVIAAKHLNEARQRVMNRFELLTGTKTSYRNADGDFLVHPKRVPDAADPKWRMTSNDDGTTSFSVTVLNETSSSHLQQLLMDVFPPEENVNIPSEIDASRTELTFVLLPHQVAMLERKMSEEILLNIAK